MTDKITPNEKVVELDTPILRGKTEITSVSGFKQPIDAGEWIITTLTHSLSAENGYTTSIELEVKIDSLEME